MTGATRRLIALAAVEAALACGSNDVPALPPDCGQSSAQWAPICDGTPHLRFATLAVGGTGDGMSSVLNELGRQFLFVDGSCHYWVRDEGNTDPIGNWYPVHDGLLSAETETRLANDFCYGDWADLQGIWGTDSSSDAMVEIFHDRTHLISWMGADSRIGQDAARFAKVQRMRQLRSTWVSRLYEEGRPMTGPMRMSAFQGRPNLLKMQEVAWPLRQPIATLVDDPTKAGPGQSHDIESDDDAMALRDIRQRFLVGSLGRFYSFILVQNDKPEEPFELYARDAISSLEDASGLIPIPPSSLADASNR